MGIRLIRAVLLWQGTVRLSSEVAMPPGSAAECTELRKRVKNGLETLAPSAFVAASQTAVTNHSDV